MKREWSQVSVSGEERMPVMDAGKKERTDTRMRIVGKARYGLAEYEIPAFIHLF